MHWAIRVRNTLVHIEQAICAVAMTALVCTVSWGVLERYVFRTGSGIPDELSRYLCIYAMMIGAGLCVARGAHVGVEVFVRMLQPKTQRIVEFISYIMCVIFCAVLAYVGFQYFGRLLATMQLTATIEFPIAYAYLAIPLGAMLMIAHYLLKLFAFQAEHEEAKQLAVEDIA